MKPPPPPQEYDREAREERRAKRRRRAASEAESAAAADAVRDDTPESSDEPTPESEFPDPAEPLPGESAGESEGTTTHVALAVTDEEGLARLRARYATIVARIGDRQREPEKLAALQAQAALTDPDAWRTVEEARERLATLDETIEALRSALGRRRRSRRGGRRRRGGSGAGQGQASGESATASAEPSASEEPPPPKSPPSDGGSD